MIIKNISIILFFLILGELTSFILHVPVPGPIFGMIFMTVSLGLNLVKLDNVKPAADVLIKNMSLFFVPPGIGLILYFDLLKYAFFAIFVSVIISTSIVLLLVGFIQQTLERKFDK